MYIGYQYTYGLAHTCLGQPIQISWEALILPIRMCMSAHVHNGISNHEHIVTVLPQITASLV